MAETAENLLRVGDIIHELAAQLPLLQEQAEQAQAYLTLRAVKTQEINLLVHDALTLRQRWYELERQAKAAADDLLGQQAAVNRTGNRAG